MALRLKLQGASGEAARWRSAFNRLVEAWRLARLRGRMFGKPRPMEVERFNMYTIRITDGPNFYMQYKDEFVRRIYDFEAVRPDPLVIDGGSNMGMSILYAKRRYPAARVIGFEPDPAIFALLEENVRRNNLQGVTLVNAGLAGRAGSAAFVPDGTAGGRAGLVEGVGTGSASRSDGDSSTIRVRMECLSDYLEGTVDFLKLNIEGEELPVLQEAAVSGKLRNVREIVLEYHGWAAGKQQLGPILSLLDEQGFRYLVHDFDAETCSASKPPFRLRIGSPWFCLVYAHNMGMPA